METIVKQKLYYSKNEEIEKHGKNSSSSHFCTNNLFTAIAVVQHFGTENNAG